jgi:NtrC-family two-component system response regulator AlgB
MQILVVDDTLNIRKTLAMSLENEGHKVVCVSNGRDALSEVSHSLFELAFVDLRLGQESGMDLFPKLLERTPRTKVVIITSYVTTPSTVEAIKKGASDYLAKPFTPDQVNELVHKMQKLMTFDEQTRLNQQSNFQGDIHPEFSSSNVKMLAVLEEARQAAMSNACILIQGENGTGKTFLAQMIHGWSKRSGRPFGVVSCPMLSKELLESELFGHVKGSFTGAVSDKLGRIEACKDGTLFLDEIGDLPLAIQPKLLRFVQDKEYERLGESFMRKADVRIVAATNHVLEKAVADGTFREDLYYRLNVICIDMPPLRERREDILPLAESFLKYFGQQNQRNLQSFSPAVRAIFVSHPWPGNLRELRNAVEHAVVMCQSPEIEVKHLPFSLSEMTSPIYVEQPKIGDPISIEKMEELHIRRVLARSKTIEEAATVLKIDGATLWRKRKKIGI